MNSTQYLKIYFLTAVIFLVLDTFWLSVLAKDMYQQRLGPVVNLEFNLTGAILFYLMYIGGIIYFAIHPAMVKQSRQLALFNGACLGFLCYSTYHLTNMATIADWPPHVVIVDMIWGMVLTGVSAFLSYMLAHKILMKRQRP